MMVLEDVDAIFHGRTPVSQHCPLSFTGLLNGLDGIGNAVGKVFFMTTNHKEVLDPALVRSGRVDKEFFFGYSDNDQIEQMFHWYYKWCGKDLARRFRIAVRKLWRDREVTC